ncbi:MAG: hypothetical protein AAF810_21640 [Cyanobacteria bacterium P01_D01_bin.36]
MIKLTGIKAFEARWQSLRVSHPTAPHENHLLMQSMGRLVDNYASQSEIAAGLPFPLQSLFDQLVDAYLNGYWVEDNTSPAASTVMSKRAMTPAMTPAMAESLQRRQRKSIKPTVASEAATYIIHDRVRCSA